MDIDYENLTNVEKVRLLEYAALNSTPEEISQVCAKLGEVEYSARALGIACRFRGVEYVRALVEGGASFHAVLSNYMVQTYDSYGDDLCIMLLSKTKLANERIPYMVIAPEFDREVKQDNGNILKPISFKERIAVLDYLCENCEKAEFDAGELLYYAIFAKDERMISELDMRGAKFSEYRIKMLSEKGKTNDFYIWTAMLQILSEKDFVPVLTQITKRMGDAKLHRTDGIYYACMDKFGRPENLEFYLKHFDNPKVNQKKIIENAIDKDAVEVLEIAVREGWLKTPRKRDEMIQYAREHKKTEALAWLLDFKNRTADLAAEAAKAEKKEQSILNAAPDSVTAMKQLWNYKKREDGTLVITGYKGRNTVITVPAQIGKNKVTAIGEYAFSPCNCRLTDEAEDFRKTITQITLPDGITEIEDNAFHHCVSLLSVNIPEGVIKIGNEAFCYCPMMKNISLPISLKTIGFSAFFKCSALEEVIIPEGVVKIDRIAFANCASLERVELPESLEKIMNANKKAYYTGCFDGSPNVTVVVPKGSYAEQYCKDNNVKFTYKDFNMEAEQ